MKNKNSIKGNIFVVLLMALVVLCGIMPLAGQKYFDCGSLAIVVLPIMLNKRKAQEWAHANARIPTVLL